MKRAIQIFFIALISQVAFSQSTTFDTIHIVSTATDSASSVFSIDLDGDLDFDILTGSMSGPGIAWHENLGGSISGTPNIISTTVDSVAYVMAVDLDGDEVPDVLAASPVLSGFNIFWHKNLGNGNFVVEQMVSSDSPHTYNVFAIDLDGDNDNDIISAESDQLIAWYENDGSGNFGARIVISDTAYGASCVHAADLDNDDDYDVIAGYGNTVSWFKNDGDGTFSMERLLTVEEYYASNVQTVTVGDMNNDNKIDVLSASWGDSKIAWYENYGYTNFNEEQKIISVLAIGASDLHPADFDGDGDLDVVSSSAMDGRIIWYQNVLGESDDDDFIRYVLTATSPGASSVHAADIDIDGDNDIISASSDNDKVQWLQNDFDFVFNWHYEYCEGDTVLVINGEEVMQTDTIYEDTLMSVFGRDSINIHYVLFNENPEPYLIEGPTTVTAGDTIVYRVNTSPNVFFLWDIVNGERVSYGISDTIAIKWLSTETGMGKITSLGYYLNPDPEKICYIEEILEVIINPAGLTEHAFDEVYVYPNPANSMLYINNYRKEYSVIIFNSSGLALIRTNQENIDISALNPGLYFVQIIDKKADLIKVSKVIIN